MLLLHDKGNINDNNDLSTIPETESKLMSKEIRDLNFVIEKKNQEITKLRQKVVELEKIIEELNDEIEELEDGVKTKGRRSKQNNQSQTQTCSLFGGKSFW